MHYVTLSLMNSVSRSMKNPWPLGLGSEHHPKVGFFNSLSMSQSLGLPTKTNPLANIVGEASPQGFQTHFDHTAQAKLAQPHLLFNPGVGKLGYPGSLFIDLLGLFGLHLRFKRNQLSGFVPAQQRAAFFTPRTTASLKPTVPTIRGPRPVTPLNPASLPLLCFKVQKLIGRTGVTVRTRIIAEGLRIKLRAHSVALQYVPRGLVSLGQRSNQINTLVCHRLDSRVRGISCVDDDLFGRLSEITLDSLYGGFQFAGVDGGLAHSNPHNHLGLGIGGNLDVVGWAKSPFGLYHSARLGVSGTGPKFFFLSLCLRLGPSTLELFQLLKRLFKPLLLLAQRSLSRLSLALTQLLRAWISHGFDLLLGLFKMTFESGFAAKTLIRRRGLDLGPVVHHALQRDQSLVAEHPQDLDEHAIERLLVLNAKIRQRVIVDHLHPCQPLVGRMILAQPRDLAGRTDPVLIGIDPQTDQHLGVPHRSARLPFQRANLGIEGLPIQLAHQLPDRSHRMLLPHKLLDIDRAQQKLISFDGFAPNGFPLSILLRGGITLHGISSTPFEPRPALCEGSIYSRPPIRCSRLSPFLELEPEEPGKSDRTGAGRWPVRRLGFWLGTPYKAPPVVGHRETLYHSYIAMTRTFYNFFTASLCQRGSFLCGISNPSLENRGRGDFDPTLRKLFNEF